MRSPPVGGVGRDPAPELPVSPVATGTQSVSYGRAVPGGDLGAAMTRAAWHRSLLSGLVSVPLRAGAQRTRPRSCPW